MEIKKNPKAILENRRVMFLQIGLLLAVLVTLLWTVFATFIILKIISLFIPLRVDEEDEIHGLDTSVHGES